MVLIETTQSGWSESEPGSLGRYAHREKARVRNRRVSKVVGIAGIFSLCIFAWIAFAPQLSTMMEPNYGGIVCTKVKSSAEAYLAGTLDKDTSSKIDLHLKQCSQCLSFIKKIRNSQASSFRHQSNEKVWHAQSAALRRERFFRLPVLARFSLIYAFLCRHSGVT